MNSLAFKIHGLDCAEEVAVLKAELATVVGGEKNLSFDILNGKMTIEVPGEPVAVETVRQAVGRTGMRAVPWEQYLATKAQGAEPFWQAHGRAVLCGASGILLLASTGLHSTAHGFLDAIGNHADGHSYPLAVVALYLAAIVSGGWFVFPKAVYAIRRMRPDMHLLMSIAVVGAIGIGEWFEAGAVAFLFSVALLLETWSVGRARKAISVLMDLSPATARYRCPHGGEILEKPVGEVPVGVCAVVRPGEKVPLDGRVVKGSTTIDQATITGESKPVSKRVGDEVYAGTLNEAGAFEFEVTKAAKDTTLANIIHLVEDAQANRAPAEQWVEKFARYYTPLMMALAAGIVTIPPLFFDASWAHWFYQGLVILVIACPCALVISTPVSIVAGLASAARAGVLVKGGMYLEMPASLRAVAFDKTGTITHGRPEVQTIFPLNGHSEAELLERAAALETLSEHPLADAILRKAAAHGVAAEAVEDFQAVQGKGAEGRYKGRAFWIGSHRLLHEKGTETPECHQKAEELEDEGHSVIAIGNDEHVCGLISVADSLREDSKETIRALKAAGVEHIVLLTGDNDGTARAVAAATGVDAFESELLPHEKVESIAALVEKYGQVAMVGDGVNDAPAMARATLGIAMGAAGSDAAIETADIALMSDDLTKLPWLIRHSRRTLAIIKQNIVFALGLKAAFVLMAIAGIATLWMAIAADMGASLLVIFNGLRLLKSST